MRFIRAYVEQIRRLWGALSTSARLAMALLAVLVAVALVWLVAGVAGQPQTVQVFRAPLGDEQTGTAQQLLRRQRIEAEVADGLLMVRADQRDDAIALLASQSILPADPASELDSLVRDSSMWRTDAESKRLWQQAKQDKLSALIAKFPGVRTAQVILEAGQPRGLGTPAVPPTASVSLSLKSGQEMDRRVVQAVADLVCGTVGNMKPSDVRIVADGQSFRAKDKEVYDGEQVALVVEQEKRFERKIQDLLGYINGVLVGVYVELDPVRSKHSEQMTYDEPVVAPVVTTSEEATNTAQRLANEPGVMTNAASKLPTAGGTDSTMERNEKAAESRFPFKRTIEEAVGGIVKNVAVSVNVPRDYLVQAVKQVKGGQVEPSEVELEAELRKIESLVRTCINAQPADPARPDNQVVVRSYVPGPPPATAAVAYAGIHLAVDSYGKQAALGALAFMALLMVVMFARRRAPSPPLLEPPSAEEMSPENTVSTIEGEDGALEGLELDDEAVRFQKVVEQIGEMVREKPEAATSLIQRWIDTH